MRIKSICEKIRLRLASPEKRADLMRKKFYFCGNNVKLYTHYFGTEPYLISIHDNVVCAAGVQFVNHDMSVFNVKRTMGWCEIKLDKVGSIELFDNCFIGAQTILMPNCSVGKNSVVAAGSVVTKHIPENQVWGGVPAKYIMSIDEYAKHITETNNNYPWVEDGKFICSGEALIKARQDYFFIK